MQRTQTALLEVTNDSELFLHCLKNAVAGVDTIAYGRSGIVGYSFLIRLWKSAPSPSHKSEQAPTFPMGPARGLGRSLGGSHLRRLFANLPGIKDEFERIGILVLLHQLQIHEPLGIGHCRAVIEPIPGRFKQ